MAQIVVSRPKGAYQDAIRRYKLTLDGKSVGKIRPGEALAFDVAPGEHAVVASLDGVKSNTLNVSCRAGQISRLEIAPSRPTGVRKIFARRPWMEIREV